MAKLVLLLGAISRYTFQSFDKNRFSFASASGNLFCKRISTAIGAIAAARAFFCLATKEAKMPGARLLGDQLFSQFGNEMNSPAAQTAFHFYEFSKNWYPPAQSKRATLTKNIFTDGEYSTRFIRELLTLQRTFLERFSVLL